nr:unnamed protein product [Spirometra erinaceieuropaei]
MKVLRHEACFNTTDADPVSLVATVESILKQAGESDETKHLIRQQVSSLAMAHKPRATITKAEQSTLKTLRADTSIVILPADKGRSTVVMDKADYIQKANALLGGQQAYLPCNDEPTRRLVTQLEKTLADMQRSKAINLAVETVSELLKSQYDETDVTVKRRHLVQLLRFCLKTYFTFEGPTYEQVKGPPMESPLSGFIAEVDLQKEETLVFSTYKPKFWARYVDDTFVIIKRQKVQEFHDVLNSVFPDIQFKMEAEANNQLPFPAFSSIENPMGTLKRRHTKTDGGQKQKPEFFRALPHVSDVSEATERMLRPLNVGLGHRPEATIRRLLMQPKGRLPPEDTSGIVYRVNCLDCPANYCGMTDKRLRSRMHEHSLAVKRKDVRSHVAMHSLENDHQFGFDTAEVIGRAESKMAREIIEAWQSNANSINRRIDLPAPYEAVRHH